ncbi:hypothetical protein [uncultured Bradyrhizobium sp.]|jgi:hypothetical protein|uniref:hypothetical protein n=1 Tax=uncultured Bradyrhizobium sp. TaxID=199684 RepID=UPI00261C52CC|nr:hypothetical protein [uncultured Bradyrhizobium sp.]
MSSLAAVYLASLPPDQAQRMSGFVDPLNSSAEVASERIAQVRARVAAVQAQRTVPQPIAAKPPATRAAQAPAALTGEQAWAAEFAATPDLQREFTDVGCYVALRKAETADRVQICRGSVISDQPQKR